MSRLAWLRLPWLFNRRIGVALLWTLLVVAAAVAVNIAGIHVVGGVEGWQHCGTSQDSCRLIHATNRPMSSACT